MKKFSKILEKKTDNLADILSNAGFAQDKDFTAKDNEITAMNKGVLFQLSKALNRAEVPHQLRGNTIVTGGKFLFESEKIDEAKKDFLQPNEFDEVLHDYAKRNKVRIAGQDNETINGKHVIRYEFEVGSSKAFSHNITKLGRNYGVQLVWRDEKTLLVAPWGATVEMYQIDEAKKDGKFSVFCYAGSYQHWSSTEKKEAPINTLEDAHKFGQKHCTNPGMWYTIYVDDKELIEERTKNIKGKFVNLGLKKKNEEKEVYESIVDYDELEDYLKTEYEFDNESTIQKIYNDLVSSSFKILKKHGVAQDKETTLKYIQESNFEDWAIDTMMVMPTELPEKEIIKKIKSLDKKEGDLTDKMAEFFNFIKMDEEEKIEESKGYKTQNFKQWALQTTEAFELDVDKKRLKEIIASIDNMKGESMFVKMEMFLTALNTRMNMMKESKDVTDAKIGDIIVLKSGERAKIISKLDGKVDFVVKTKSGEKRNINYNAIDSIVKEDNEIIEESKYFAFWKGKKHEVEADSLYAAKTKAIDMLKIPKSKQSLLAIMNAEAYDNNEFMFDSKIEENLEFGETYAEIISDYVDDVNPKEEEKGISNVLKALNASINDIVIYQPDDWDEAQDELGDAKKKMKEISINSNFYDKAFFGKFNGVPAVIFDNTNSYGGGDLFLYFKK